MSSIFLDEYKEWIAEELEKFWDMNEQGRNLICEYHRENWPNLHPDDDFEKFESMCQDILYEELMQYLEDQASEIMPSKIDWSHFLETYYGREK